MPTSINPCSSPLRLHGHTALMPLASTAHVQLNTQRTQQQQRAPRGGLVVVTATAATDAPKEGKKQLAAKKKRDHPEVPNMPLPKAFQQTVRASFTIMGIGLHTAELAVVRVRPALAGEGRYFVRVPEGTNRWRADMEELDEYEEHEWIEKQLYLDREEESKKLAEFMTYLRARDNEEFYGEFDDWLRENDKAAWAEDLIKRQTAIEDEVVQPRAADEPHCPAAIHCAQATNPHYLHLQQDDITVLGAESLLAALEACGVDNARIEMEGGNEVPVIDGSALGWLVALEETGVKEALFGKRERAKRMAWKPTRPVTVTGSNGAFVQMVPDALQRVTAGLDVLPMAPVVGQKWFTWTPAHDAEAFRWDVGPARPFAPTIQGFIKGGTSQNHIVADDDNYTDGTMVRYFNDEPARHTVVDTTVRCWCIMEKTGAHNSTMQAVLSLLAAGGGTGIPYAHVLSYQADMALLVEAAQAIVQACQEGSQVAWSPASE